ncbi:MAG: hypothetical protein WCL39_01205 [Armatimonadota bacterium]
MNRWVILITLCLFPSLVPTPVHAVQLEQGWYVGFDGVGIFGNDYSTGQEWMETWKPESSQGVFGFLRVDNVSPYIAPGRTVTIIGSTSVSAGIIFEDTGATLPEAPFWTFIDFSWKSNCDLSKLQLQVWTRRPNQPDRLLWTQQKWAGVVRLPTYGMVKSGDNVIFRLAVVPEPSGLSFLSVLTAVYLLGCLRIRNRCAIFCLAIWLSCQSSGDCALSPGNIAVVVNADFPKDQPTDTYNLSQVTGRYYCSKLGIPPTNIIEITTLSSENVNESQYAGISQQIRSKLVSQLGVDPNDPANDPIQALVLCYGIPSQITFPPAIPVQYPISVDSFLTLLFNKDPDLQPGDTLANGQHLRLNNPYLSQDSEFSAFRASAGNRLLY